MINLELKKYVVDFNYLVARINKAEMLQREGEFDNYTPEKFDKVSEGLQELIKQACEVAYNISKILGRPLTGYECLHGINI